MNIFLLQSNPTHINLFAMERDYLTTRQVARVVGVSLNTIYRWLKSERIDEPHRDPTNNYRLWTAADVEKIRRLNALEES
jgi:DNA-binding transcriptional MerR regulator